MYIWTDSTITLRLRVIVHHQTTLLYNSPPLSDIKHQIGQASFVELMALARNFSALTTFPPWASPLWERPLALLTP